MLLTDYFKLILKVKSTTGFSTNCRTKIEPNVSLLIMLSETI